jgi:hypothetical protein
MRSLLLRRCLVVMRAGSQASATRVDREYEGERQYGGATTLEEPKARHKARNLWLQGLHRNELRVASPGTQKHRQGMKQPAAKTAREYLDQQSPDRRATLERVRDVILANLPAGYEEMMGWGAMTYAIPLSRYANTYNGEPLCYLAMANQKNYVALYLMSAYGHGPILARVKAAFKANGLKLDMGKSCIRFRTAEDLPLRELGDIIAQIPSEKWIEIYETNRGKAVRRKGGTKKRKGATKTRATR